MIAKAWIAVLALASVSPSPRATLPRSPAAQAVDPTATCTLAFQPRQVTTFQYRAQAWNAEAVAQARADAGLRGRMNQLLPLQLPLELSLPMTLRVGERNLAAGAHRLTLALDDGGAWELRLLDGEGQWQSLPLQLTDGGPEAPYLSFSLVPAQDGLMALVLHWGRESGRLLFRSGKAQ